jgi:hypothetical protein
LLLFFCGSILLLATEKKKPHRTRKKANGIISEMRKKNTKVIREKMKYKSYALLHRSLIFFLLLLLSIYLQLLKIQDENRFRK